MRAGRGAGPARLDRHRRDPRVRGLAAGAGAGPRPARAPGHGQPEQLAAFWLTLDAINFGSGWFPTLPSATAARAISRSRPGSRERFERRGPWRAEELAQIEPAEIAAAVGQDPQHELMALFAASLRDLGRHVGRRMAELRTRSSRRGRLGGRARHPARRLGLLRGRLALRRRASPVLQARADRRRRPRPRRRLPASDLGRLTIFADNLVPHVLRLDGVLSFDPELVARIDREELIEHGSPEEVEIRACALHAVELIVAARGGRDSITAAVVDQQLWNRGQGARYKASPRHRSRCTAY